MKIAYVLGLLAAFTIACRGSDTNPILHITIDSSQCTFYYSSHRNQNFLFYYCEVGNSTISLWTECLSKCCKSMPSIDETPSISSLNVCRSGGVQIDSFTKERVAIIVVSTIFGFILIGGLIFVVRRCCKNLKYRKGIEEKRKYMERKQSILTGKKTGNIPLEQFSPFKVKNSKTTSNSQQICCVCLDAKTSAELRCRHRYHPSCIKEWLKRDSLCPQCRVQIFEVKIYCVGCNYKYFICPTDTLLEEELQDFNKRCQDCEKIQKSRDSFQQEIGNTNLIEMGSFQEHHRNESMLNINERLSV